MKEFYNIETSYLVKDNWIFKANSKRLEVSHATYVYALF